jgi:hypothetical protein
LRRRWPAPLRLETHPELEHNPTAAFFQVEVNETAEALGDLCQQLKDRIPPGDSELLRTVNEWLAGVIRRTVPGAIVSEGSSFRESGRGDAGLAEPGAHP